MKNIKQAGGFEDELRKQIQLNIVKEVEIDSLRKQVKKYKDLAGEAES